MHMKNLELIRTDRFVGIFHWKSLWHSRGYCFQHAMQIKGNVPNFQPLTVIVFVISNLSLSQGDGDYELVKEVTFDDYLRKRIAKVCFFFFFSNSVNVKSTGIHVMIQC